MASHVHINAHTCAHTDPGCDPLACRDTFALCCLNSGTSIFAGFAVFSIMGFMAHELGVEIAEIQAAGETSLFSFKASVSLSDRIVIQITSNPQMIHPSNEHMLFI